MALNSQSLQQIFSMVKQDCIIRVGGVWARGELSDYLYLLLHHQDDL